MKQKDLTPEQRERGRLQNQKYYQKHRKQTLTRQREYCRKKGRA